MDIKAAAESLKKNPLPTISVIFMLVIGGMWKTDQNKSEAHVKKQDAEIVQLRADFKELNEEFREYVEDN